MKSLFVVANVISLLVSPFSVYPVYIDGSNVFPQTRDTSLKWSWKVQIFDLGISETTTYSSNTISYQSADHQYSVTNEYMINCSSACTLSMNTQPGYNIDENTVVVYYTQKYEATPDQISSYINGQLQGTAGGSYTFTSENDFNVVSFNVNIVGGGSLPISVVFPALTQGIVLDSINTQLGALFTSWSGWKALDEEHKIRELQQWIYEMNQSSMIPNTVIINAQNLLNSGDPDGAFTVINNYYQSSVQEQNESVTNHINTNDNTRNALDDAISDENQVASTFESSFDAAQNNINTNNPVLGISNFANSANWVRVQFERFTTDNAFGTLLGFSLLLGLALAIIGRIL